MIEETGESCRMEDRTKQYIHTYIQERMAVPVISDRIKDSYMDKMPGTMQASVYHSVNKRNLDIVPVSKKKRKP